MKGKKRKSRDKVTSDFLKKLKVPQVLIPGLIIASVMGWTGWKNMTKVDDYHKIKEIFPTETQAVDVVDGDTMIITNGMSLRLLGINAPGRGEEDYEKSKKYLDGLVKEKRLTLEYDSYQDDKYVRILAYIWIACIDYIKEYCHEDRALVNEIMLKKKMAKKVIYSKRKKLKYDEFLIE